jgi:hypothetical protein
LRQRTEKVLDFAISHGYPDAPNPARWRGNLDAILPRPSKLITVQHFRALPYREIGQFMARLRAVDSTNARALEHPILAAQRNPICEVDRD